MFVGVVMSHAVLYTSEEWLVTKAKKEENS
jgi:hypothetical protein